MHLFLTNKTSPRLSIDRWGLAAFLIAAVVIVPLGVVLSSVFSAHDDVWAHLIETTLAGILINTFWLTLGVAIGTSVLGVSLAWLTAATDFPGRRFFDWALMLPMAIPSYVTAFVAIGLLDFSGPLQTVLRLWLGKDGFWFPEIRSRGGVILVMTLTLYPYVYLLARNAFLTQGRRALEAAQSLGASRLSGFFRVALPMARPWIVGGVMLALMETLSDFGAVSIFNYDTFATAIYQAWFGFFSVSAASQLASFLVLLVFILLLLEQKLTARTRYTSTSLTTRQGDRIQLKGMTRWFAVMIAFLVFLIAFIVPVTQLLIWSVSIAGEDFDARYFVYLGHSLSLGGGAALMTVAAVLILVYSQRLRPTVMIRVLVRISTLGYALPGSVLAVGIFIPFAWLDHQTMTYLDRPFILKGTVAAMLLAYLVRFLAVAYHPVQSVIKRISQHIDESAQNLGCSGIEMLRRVHLPMMRSGVLTALVLVFVDVMKEMPITLMMRPFGWDTLAIRIYEMTSEGEWERAALPAIAIVLAGLIPVFLLARDRERGF
ncbi:Ferric iron ABC transporter, permease protein [hydrothermal vent metagenome]|uniref:Ferric iron ABC transporter, permease protein n=1 Tax=hydrothermal vent metagenome TaxID=652676 RepID=A0A3B1D846_9ZZZZ